MEICQECHTAPATVHVTQIVSGETSVFHLCEECARQKGIHIQIGPPGEDVTSSEENRPGLVCPCCGLEYSRMKQEGWLGCSACYQAFEEQLNELLLQVHGHVTHLGKGSSEACHRQKSGQATVRSLQKELEAAIQDEEFETAARLRDTLQKIRAESSHLVHTSSHDHHQ